MVCVKKLILVFCCLFVLILPAAAATDVDFPYGEFKIKSPPLEDPYPGIGSYYSTVSKGIGTILWNPAALVNIGTTEAMLGISGASALEKFDKLFNIKDTTFEADVSGAGSFTGAAHFDTPANSTSVRTREVMGHYNYLTESGGITYQQALRLNDWLSAGIIYRGPVESSLNVVGDFPTTIKYNLSMSGASLEGAPMWFDANNRISYSYTIPGTTTTVTSTSATPVWNSFITQEATLPLTSFAEFRNNISVDSDFTACLAGKVKGVSIGLNLTPIGAEMKIDNSLRTIVNSGAADITIYNPNIDMNSAEAIANWFYNQNLYGTSAGYNQKVSKVPAGQTVADGKYRGFYTASAMRMDLGAMYDINDYFRVGLAYENFGAAALNFSGSGRATYAQTRLGTVEFSDVLDPAKNTSPSFFRDTFSPVDGTQDYSLEPTKSYSLPQKLRFGFAFIKPMLIAIDYESQLNPIKFRAQNANGAYQEMKISNINMVRLGADFGLIKGGTTLLLKPTVDGTDTNTQKNINTAFKYGVVPLKLDLGTTFNLWGVRNDSYVGFNGTSILDMLQFNTLSSDLSKLLYYGLSFSRDYWTLSYLANVDPGATAAGYYAAKDTDPGHTFGYGDVKWISTWQIGYRF